MVKELKYSALGEARKKIENIPRIWKLIWLVLTLTVSVTLIALLLGIDILPIIIADFFLIFGPIAALTYWKQKRITSIETHFPGFLRDLAEFRRAGISLPQAVENASENDYGQLSPEVERMAMEMSWGNSFKQGMETLKDRVESDMIKRAVSILTAAQESGGDITSILETISADLQKLKELQEERKSKLSVYTATIYVIYLLLLFIIVMLAETLAPAIPKIQTAGQFLGGGGSEISEKAFRELLYHVSLIEAFFAGLISGKMGTGRITAGIKHSIILVSVTLGVFFFIQPPGPMIQMSNNIIEVPPVEGFRGGQLSKTLTFTQTISTKKIAEKVREIAKSKNRPKYKDITADDIKFSQRNCKPCREGKITITKNKITVTQSAELEVSTSYRNGQYVIAMQTPTS